MYDNNDGLGALPTIKDYYAPTLEFSATITAGTNANASSRLDRAWRFIIQAIGVTIWTPAAISSMVTGSEFASETDSTLTATVGNVVPTYNHFRLMIVIDDTQIWRNPVRCGMLQGSKGQMHPLFTPIVCKAGIDIKGILYNDSAATAQAQVLLEGYYDRINKK